MHFGVGADSSPQLSFEAAAQLERALKQGTRRSTVVDVVRGLAKSIRASRHSPCKGLVITAANIQVATGVVTLKGTVKCIGDEGVVHLEPIMLAQKQGNNVVKGLDETGLDCNDPAASFIVMMDADQGKFQKGKAIVSGKALIGTQAIALCPVKVRLRPL